MLLLFDTSTTTAVVALADHEGGSLIREREYTRDEGGASLILTGALEMLEEADRDITSLTGVVINRGPGSYTGLRVGYALAQGLSESLRIPVATVPSFCAFADQYRTDTASLCVCYDARSRGTAWVTYLQEETRPLRQGAGSSKRGHLALAEEVVELGEDEVVLQIAPAEAIPGLVPRPCRLAGPGVERFIASFDHDLPDDMELIIGSDRAASEHLLRLGSAALLTGGEDILKVLPFYLGTMEAAPQRRKP
ncbi:tRNA (adenosine(37)-N6)-threonylcarbamoyltransferase complex dimerization subunit type 1 TsaB [Gemmatimonadota bacterium]